MAQKICRPPRAERHICAACTTNIKITYAFRWALPPLIYFLVHDSSSSTCKALELTRQHSGFSVPSRCYASLLQPVSLILSLHLFDLRQKKKKRRSFSVHLLSLSYRVTDNMPFAPAATRQNRSWEWAAPSLSQTLENDLHIRINYWDPADI